LVGGRRRGRATAGSAASAACLLQHHMARTKQASLRWSIAPHTQRLDIRLGSNGAWRRCVAKTPRDGGERTLPRVRRGTRRRLAALRFHYCTVPVARGVTRRGYSAGWWRLRASAALRSGDSVDCYARYAAVTACIRTMRVPFCPCATSLFWTRHSPPPSMPGVSLYFAKKQPVASETLRCMKKKTAACALRKTPFCTHLPAACLACAVSFSFRLLRGFSVRVTMPLPAPRSPARGHQDRV